MDTTNGKPLIVIVGETASGKTDLAIRIAVNFHGEIICADSSTIRQELDIGTAKPTSSERKKIPHHLLDIINPDEDFSAAEFKKLANRAITDIHSRNRIPILVGGSGLYVDSVLFDYSFLPKSNKKIRDALNELKLEELRTRANNITGAKLKHDDLNNRHRLIRLIEVNGIKPEKKTIRKNTLILGIKYTPQEINDRIEKRMKSMLEKGLEKEVRDLTEKYSWSSPALKSINYIQWKEYIYGEESYEELCNKLLKANKHLAKKQRTWFYRNKSIQWISTPVKWSTVVETITTFLYS